MEVLYEKLTQTHYSMLENYSPHDLAELLNQLSEIKGNGVAKKSRKKKKTH